MAAAFVLVHSLLVGPATWRPVADRLKDQGRHTVVPSLVHVGGSGPPYWPRVVDAVATALHDAEQEGRTAPVILAAHSNAGLFLPVITASLAGRVVGAVFVDATLPARFGSTPAAPPPWLEELRAKAGQDGLLPPWTEWWAEEDVAPLFPDPATRARVSAEQPRLPLAYYEQRIPVPDGWDAGVTCGYLLFGPPYDEVADEAARRGMRVDRMPGLHLHQLVDPGGVAGYLAAFEERIGAR